MHAFQSANDTWMDDEKGPGRRTRRPQTRPQMWYSRLLVSARIANSATFEYVDVCFGFTILRFHLVQ